MLHAKRVETFNTIANGDTRPDRTSETILLEVKKEPSQRKNEDDIHVETHAFSSMSQKEWSVRRQCDLPELRKQLDISFWSSRKAIKDLPWHDGDTLVFPSFKTSKLDDYKKAFGQQGAILREILDARHEEWEKFVSFRVYKLAKVPCTLLPFNLSLIDFFRKMLHCTRYGNASHLVIPIPRSCTEMGIGVEANPAGDLPLPRPFRSLSNDIVRTGYYW